MRRSHLIAAMAVCGAQTFDLGCSNLTAPPSEDFEQLPQLADRGAPAPPAQPRDGAEPPPANDTASVQRIVIAWKGAEGAHEKVSRSEQDARKLAIDLGEKARADGADFAQLARTHSDAPDASSGGQLPPFTRTDDVDQLTKSAAFRLQPGQISGVLATPKGFMIIKRLQ